MVEAREGEQQIYQLRQKEKRRQQTTPRNVLISVALSTELEKDKFCTFDKDLDKFEAQSVVANQKAVVRNKTGGGNEEEQEDLPLLVTTRTQLQRPIRGRK
mmetsp:Transcript_20005/g.37648  ORF Transcript_20005/g.37648 Transcript_20005/m.37648 type:complete len:101 (-) Transcript_20005:440-742(-)